ncbi:MAG: peptidylprolyl isomerase [Firmicutes bacterium]|nr:peptidylprolyl isomerase [Bacillota bacterium]
MKTKKIISLIMAGALCLSLAACAGSGESTDSGSSETVDYSDESNPVAEITMSDGSVIKIELYPEAAPNTVNNFIYLANSGFYDGLTFHRIIPGFMIQGGDPKGDGTGGPGYSIAGEFEDNGFENSLKHTRGVISMARAQSYDSAGSQFFIMAADTHSLDGQYAAFGKVAEGMEVVDKIVGAERDSNDKPVESIVMSKVTVDLKGKTYSDPVKK